MSIRIFLIDDHALVLKGFQMILDDQKNMEVVGTATSGEEGYPMVRKLKPDILLCDLQLPGISGLEITERVQSALPETRVIIVSVLEDGPLPMRLLEAGAWGYLSKAGSAEELLRAVNDVAGGRKSLGHSVAQKMALSRIEDNKTPFDQLTTRELEVALLLLQGLRQEQIAKKLSLSSKTINTHKVRLFEKMGVKDIISLSRIAKNYNLLEASALPQ